MDEMTNKALNKALGALQSARNVYRRFNVETEKMDNAIEAVSAALAECRGIPKGFIPVEEMIARHEADPKKKAALDRARERLAQAAQEPHRNSPTAGMSIAQRILHVGGRNNAAGYVEFGSIQAVEALVFQVLRDLPTQRECDGQSSDA